jgi:hypothetical protein
VRIAIFKDDLEDSRDSFMRDAAPVAVRIEKIEGQNVAVFQYQSEQDLWTMFIAFPQKGVVLVATNEESRGTCWLGCGARRENGPFRTTCRNGIM